MESAAVCFHYITLLCVTILFIQSSVVGNWDRFQFAFIMSKSAIIILVKVFG